MLTLAAAPAFSAAPVLGPLGRLPFPPVAERGQAGLIRAGWYQHGSQGGPAARPDGSGQALALYQLALVDAWREKNFVLMADAFFLSDRRTGPAVSPTQASWLVGAALDQGPWRLEAAREDHRPLDRDGRRFQAWRTAAHARWGGTPGGTRDGTLPAGLSYARPSNSPTLTGDWGVTWYFFNKTLPGRSDLTGIEHLRYSFRGTFAPAKAPWRLVGSLELPTVGSRWSASELDTAVGAALRWGDGELTVTREGRDVLDGPGYHAWWQAAFSWTFSAPEGAL